MPGRREVDIQRSNDQRRSHRGAKMVKSWMLSRCGVWCLAPFHARLPVFHISRFKLRSFQPDGSPWGGPGGLGGDGTLPDFAPSKPLYLVYFLS